MHAHLNSYVLVITFVSGYFYPRNRYLNFIFHRFLAGQGARVAVQSALFRKLLESQLLCFLIQEQDPCLVSSFVLCLHMGFLWVAYIKIPRVNGNNLTLVLFLLFFISVLVRIPCNCLCKTSKWSVKTN